LPEDTIGGIRRILQDLIAPEVGRLHERVASVSSECVRLGEDIKTNRAEIKDIWGEIRKFGERIAKVEGRIENVKEEVVAKAILEFQRRSQPQSTPPALPAGEQ